MCQGCFSSLKGSNGWLARNGGGKENLEASGLSFNMISSCLYFHFCPVKGRGSRQSLFLVLEAVLRSPGRMLLRIKWAAQGGIGSAKSVKWQIQSVSFGRQRVTIRSSRGVSLATDRVREAKKSMTGAWWAGLGCGLGHSHQKSGAGAGQGQVIIDVKD